MLRFHARQFIDAVEDINIVHRTAQAFAQDRPDAEIKWSDIKDDFEPLEQHLRDLRLPMCVAQVERIKKQTLGTAYRFEFKVTGDVLVEQVSDLRRRINDELDQRLFYCIRSEHSARFFFRPDGSHYLELRPLSEIFGLSVIQQFFLNDEFEPSQAVQCLVRGCDTAAVFHLMRMLESGLGPFAALFGVSMDHKNWAPAIEEIERHIKEMHRTAPWNGLDDCKDRQEAYAQTASHFDMLRLAWRNYTAHGRGKYNEDEADAIFRSVKGFLGRAADVLTRYPTPSAH